MYSPPENSKQVVGLEIYPLSYIIICATYWTLLELKYERIKNVFLFLNFRSKGKI